MDFTREYFISELAQLRKWMGDRSFWKGNKPSNAMRGLLYVYANAEDLTDNDISLMQATTTEFDMRLALVIGSGVYQKDEI
jgi:hypothetical protein